GTRAPGRVDHPPGRSLAFGAPHAGAGPRPGRDRAPGARRTAAPRGAAGDPPGGRRSRQDGQMFDSKELVKELQGMRDDGHLSDALLRRAVRRIASSDKRFSWTGVYLLDREANELWLHNYVGSPTEHAKIPVGTGICGTAVAEKQNQNVPDVRKVENYLS